MAIQANILDRMPGLVAPQGFLAYATCSLLKAENGDQIDTFLSRNPGWNCIGQKAWTPLSGGDGFFLSFLTREV
jgi:16S rRNA (cytosine967-C5)-methyltransferase